MLMRFPRPVRRVMSLLRIKWNRLTGRKAWIDVDIGPLTWAERDELLFGIRP